MQAVRKERIYIMSSVRLLLWAETPHIEPCVSEKISHGFASERYVAQRAVTEGALPYGRQFLLHCPPPQSHVAMILRTQCNYYVVCCTDFLVRVPTR